MADTPRINPFTAIAVEGAVLVEAGGYAMAMTPEAALASAMDLVAASAHAKRQATVRGGS
ncbi:hypothetical protein [Sphingomonas sp. Leaf30]|jgi:hypothetical protein|uniref:hypothetical protein n=1 Tax=Sphingomonas sp. Leaf30 TaxID=1736213 RepID=UPI000B0C0334|nr:hypothetical protein [Sphingomonas sp. Leaf30]